MKRGISLFAAAALSFGILISGFSVFAAESSTGGPVLNAPYLESISFTNADIDGGFSEGKTKFTVTLKDPSVSPMLDSYKVNGTARLFVNYIFDESKRQTGVEVTLEFESGSVRYTFDYSNAKEYEVTGNANLSDLICDYGEVVPAVNAEDTDYKLYIPSDLSRLKLTPVTQNVNASCSPLDISLNETQEPKLNFTVLASNGSTKHYTFQILRVDKTLDEVREEMNSSDYVSFVTDEKFYEKPEFLIAVGSAAAAAIVLYLLAVIIRRAALSPYDREEKNFYAREEK